MKLAEFKIENNIAEFHNSFLGVESVLLNGKEISKGYSTFGKDHIFTIDGDNYNIRPHLSFDKVGGIGLSIHKNGLPISIKNNISPRHRRKLILKYLGMILLGLVIGMIVGWSVGTIIGEGLSHLVAHF